MFSTGQWIFAGIFVIVFTGILIASYRRDRNLHKKNYPGVIWVGVTFVIFVILLFLIKNLLKN